jgi:putative ABC transport system permease protein
VVLRTKGDPRELTGLVRAQLRAFDPELPIDIRTMEDHVLTSVRGPRFNALLLGSAGAVALLLALIGIYGVMSYSVARRTHEIGIRTALGAGTGDVLRLVMGKALALAGAGIVLGLAGALALSSTLDTMLFEVEPTDPLTYFLIVLLLATVSVLAAYLPTRRALRVDPLISLRAE